MGTGSSLCAPGRDYAQCVCAWVPDPDNPDLKLLSLSGQVVDTACKVCQAYLGQLEHEDIDVSDASAEALSEEEWNDLTHQYYLLVQ